MEINAISELVGVLLAMSLATERLVTIVRTPGVIGQFFNVEKEADVDGPRKLRVQALSFACAWISCAFLASGSWDPMGKIEIGGQDYRVAFVAFLAMGGSSFWKNFLGYTKAVRDVRRKELGSDA